MNPAIDIVTPLDDAIIARLVAGDLVSLSGAIYTARDAAHKRLVELMEKGQPLPFDFQGQIVFYAGPCPHGPGRVIGSVGPTTSGRMDAYSPQLIRRGLKAMLGKGLRGPEVVRAVVECRGVYFAAIGGAAALMSRCVQKVEMIAFEDLGAEAIRRLTVAKLPAVVALDSHGRNIYRPAAPAPR